MKIAMVGAGSWARVHLEILTQEACIEVVGHVHPHPEKLETAIQRWGGRAYANCEELLNHEQVDAVWVTVPPGSHGEIEQSLITRRIPFFVEKPLSADRKTAETISEAIDRAGLIVGVGYHWRAMDTIPLVKEKLAGKSVRMVLAAWHDATPPPGWWHRQETCGGQIVEQATHLFDIARLLVGEARVLASTASRTDRATYPDMDVADISAALLQFDQGAKGVFTATCLLGGPAEIHVQLVCDGLFITLTQQGALFDYGCEKIEINMGNNPFQTENLAFIKAIQQINPSLLFSSYADALKTHHLTHDVFEKSQ